MTHGTISRISIPAVTSLGDFQNRLETYHLPITISPRGIIATPYGSCPPGPEWLTCMTSAVRDGVHEALLRRCGRDTAWHRAESIARFERARYLVLRKRREETRREFEKQQHRRKRPTAPAPPPAPKPVKPLDPWMVLGVRRGADQAAIKSAYRRQAMLHHPDLVGGSLAKMQMINEAKSLLLQ